jgi:hypothetical protein
MGREEEELRYKSAQDQQTRWRSHVFTGAQKVQHQPLAPQLQLNSAYRGDDDDDGAEFRGAAAAAAAAPAAPAAPAAAAAAPVASAGLARTSGEAKAARAPPDYDVKPLVIFVCVAAAAALFALSKNTARRVDTQRHCISTENVFKIFNNKY